MYDRAGQVTRGIARVQLNQTDLILMFERGVAERSVTAFLILLKIQVAAILILRKLWNTAFLFWPRLWVEYIPTAKTVIESSELTRVLVLLARSIRMAPDLWHALQRFDARKMYWND